MVHLASSLSKTRLQQVTIELYKIYFKSNNNNIRICIKKIKMLLFFVVGVVFVVVLTRVFLTTQEECFEVARFLRGT